MSNAYNAAEAASPVQLSPWWQALEPAADTLRDCIRTAKREEQKFERLSAAARPDAARLEQSRAALALALANYHTAREKFYGLMERPRHD
jgi:hypothetical protein